jgi:hypothetical protein
MSLFQPSRQAFKPHAHAASEVCPLCEQPIAQDIARKIEGRRQEQYQAARERARAEEKLAAEQEVAAARAEEKRAAEAALAARLTEFQAQLADAEKAKVAAEHKVASARAEERLAAEAATTARLAEFQSRLAEAEKARSSVQEQMAALREAQDAAIEKRVAEIQEGMLRQKEDLQREKEVQVLAEKSKVLKLQSELADMQRKLEGRTANELGEGSEIDLFEQLKATFEGDRIWRVGKGVNGADVIHEVVHNGKVCGKIVYDAKNRNAWQNEFVIKLRADKIAQAADHAILASNKFPRDKAQVHYQDGVIVANPARVAAIVQLLRDQVVRMHELRISKEGREQKSVEIYAFITSEHCKQLLDQVETQAGRMLELDTKEQEAHRRLWDQRKKLISSVQKARSDLVFEIDRIIGTAGNGPEEDAA